MTTYESPRYKELGFYVNGDYRRFSGGFYVTDDDVTIAVLDTISDVVRVETENDNSEEPAAEKPSVSKTPRSRKATSE